MLDLLIDVFNLLSVDKSINDPLKAFATLDHVNDQNSLMISEILWNILLELLVSSANSKHEAVSLELTTQSG